MRRAVGWGTSMTNSAIPTLDLSSHGTPEFVENLSNAFSEIGFVAFKNHGLSAKLRASAFDVVDSFFSLPATTKMKYFVPQGAGARGYTAFGAEVAKDSDVPDLKEFFHVGRELAKEKRTPLTDNIWPDEVSEFRSMLSSLYGVLDGIGSTVLRSIALGLQLDGDYFLDKTNVGNSLVRALHYPPIDGEQSGAVRAAAHEDINLITLLIGTAQPGLEVLSKSGEWISAPGGDELILCNVGDMLQRLTNHALVSTTHRVVNPPAPYCEQSRFALPFFLHPNSDFVIKTLEGCISEENPNRYPSSLTADAFLQERLREIGLL